MLSYCGKIYITYLSSSPLTIQHITVLITTDTVSDPFSIFFLKLLFATSEAGVLTLTVHWLMLMNCPPCPRSGTESVASVEDRSA